MGSASKSATYSNVADLLQEEIEITRDPETIIAQKPDILVTRPFFLGGRGRRVVQGGDCGDSDGTEAAPVGP